MRELDTQAFSQEWCFHAGLVPWWGPKGYAQDLEDTAWPKVVLPHCWNAADTFTPCRGYYRGVGWYRKRIDVPAAWQGRKVFLEFGAAFALADVWINEEHAGQFMGGFTGFAIDATDFLRPGSNLLAVRVDNTHNPDILPGLEELDYNLYGGLYREVSVVVTDEVFIPQYGVTITTPTVSRERATARVWAAVRNDRDAAVHARCVVAIHDPDGAPVAEVFAEQSIESGGAARFELPALDIPSPALWSPDTPHLYSATTRVEVDGAVVDEVVTPFGLRWYEFTVDDGFFLNGEHLKLRGVNRHQDYPGLGNAVPPRLQARDAELIKEMGGNFVRASHYPQHPAFLDACDRLGIIVYEEIASWQYIGGEQFAKNAEQMMREMIARDKNHPSIILWGLLNEGRARDLFERLHRVANEADPARLTVYADNRPAEGKETGTAHVPDVLGINYKLPHLDEIRADLPDRKLVSSEHTNFCHTRRGDFEMDLGQVERLKNDTDIIEAQPFMAGGALWCMHDYGTDYVMSWPIQCSGVLDVYRLPKAGFHYLRSRWSPDPVVHICGHWTWPGLEGQARPVAVVTNCEEVELFLNGASLGVRSGENPACWDVPYEPGELKAVGQYGGQDVEYILRTAGVAARLILEASPATLACDGADVSEVTLRVVDDESVLVPQAEGLAVFDLDGPAHIRGIGGQPVTPVHAGVGRIAVQAATTPGQVLLRAAFRGLPEAEIAIAVA